MNSPSALRALTVVSSLLVLAAGCHQRQAATPRETVPLSQSLSLADTLLPKRLHIGFGIDYLNTVPRYEEALDRVAADGFVHLRAYEPFSRLGDPDFSLILRSIGFIVDRGFELTLTLSNYPYDQLPAEERRGMAELPAEVRADILTYSNRYPPRDLQRYQAQLTDLFGRLEREFGEETVTRWYIEIGNEPDAPRYFWGRLQDFRDIFWTTADLLNELYPKLAVGGSAFTSGLVLDPAKHPGYAELAREIAVSPRTDFVSFHVYSSGFPEERPTAEYVRNLVGDAGRKVISEWNVSTRPRGRAQEILGSSRILPYLLDILHLSYEADVELLMIHKLMDDPRGAGPQLGFFDQSGNPKGGYRYLTLVRELIEGGYTSVSNTSYTLVQGSESLLIAAGEADLELSFELDEVIESSFDPKANAGQFPANGWVLLKRGRGEAEAGAMRIGEDGNRNED